MNELCVCNSGKRYEVCCKPLLDGKQYAKTPVQLMRSRFSAFALGGHGEYLLSTWSPSQRMGLSHEELSFRSTDWVSLDVVNKSQCGDKGVVEFKAHYREPDGNISVHHEYSSFERVKGKWFYFSGEIR